MRMLLKATLDTDKSGRVLQEGRMQEVLGSVLERLLTAAVRLKGGRYGVPVSSDSTSTMSSLIGAGKPTSPACPAWGTLKWSSGRESVPLAHPCAAAAAAAVCSYSSWRRHHP